VFRDSFDVSGLEGARRFCSLCLRQAKAIAASAVEVHALRRTQFMVGKCAADAQAYSCKRPACLFAGLASWQ
jgi:hypothetical protein